ncbi:MAG TPA: hypothetical protein VL460_10430 [Caulobacteraceae bacterium]|jgi:hypothetical protein|nr:hypothetical protein [Caulobacteraceae bacterium]
MQSFSSDRPPSRWEDAAAQVQSAGRPADTRFDPPRAEAEMRRAVQQLRRTLDLLPE